MKISLTTQDNDVFKEFKESAMSQNIDISNAKSEINLSKNVNEDDCDAYVMFTSNNDFIQKYVDIIKKSNKYLVIVIISEVSNDIKNADLYIPEIKDNTLLSNMIFQNINNYQKNFGSLVKLSKKTNDVVIFGDCQYDPLKRSLYHNEEFVKKMSIKEGGLLELLSSNFGKVVTKDLILEKLWYDNNYFSGRSMDVYVTSLRNIFKKNGMNFSIINISGVGLMMENS